MCGAVLSVLNERKSLHSSERKEGPDRNALKTKVRGMGEMKAGLCRMGQLFQTSGDKSHSRGTRRRKGLPVEAGLGAHESL